MTTIYGPLSSRKEVDYVDDGYYSPAYRKLTTSREKLSVVQTLLDDILETVPETPAKSAAVLHLHTASMWLDKAIAQGYEALRAAYNRQQEQVKAQQAQEAVFAKAAKAEDTRPEAGSGMQLPRA